MNRHIVLGRIWFVWCLAAPYPESGQWTLNRSSSWLISKPQLRILLHLGVHQSLWQCISWLTADPIGNSRSLYANHPSGPFPISPACVSFPQVPRCPATRNRGCARPSALHLDPPYHTPPFLAINHRDHSLFLRHRTVPALLYQ